MFCHGLDSYVGIQPVILSNYEYNRIKLINELFSVYMKGGIDEKYHFVGHNGNIF